MLRLSYCSAVFFALTASACTGSAPLDDLEPDAGMGSGEPTPDASCSAVEHAVTPVVPSIQLLIDRSDSMATNMPGTTVSRFKTVQRALIGQNGAVRQVQDKALFGASVFTTDSPCARIYATPRAQSNLAEIKALLDSQTPGGFSPIPAGINKTVASFAESPPPAGSPPIIIVATDGVPRSCSNNDTQAQAITAAANAYAAGIRVFAVGIDGVNATFLQGLANAGQGVAEGQPDAPFYMGATQDELAAAFQQIIGPAVSCDLSISPAVDPSAVTVTLSGAPLTFGSDWQLVGDSTIRVLGGACDALQAADSSQVSVSSSSCAM